MEMRGVWGRWDAAELTRRAVDAGCDLFIGGGGGLDGRHAQTEIQFELMETLPGRSSAERWSKRACFYPAHRLIRIGSRASSVPRRIAPSPRKSSGASPGSSEATPQTDEFRGRLLQPRRSS
jgi:hypothetical protein